MLLHGYGFVCNSIHSNGDGEENIVEPLPCMGSVEQLGSSTGSHWKVKRLLGDLSMTRLLGFMPGSLLSSGLTKLDVVLSYDNNSTHLYREGRMQLVSLSSNGRTLLHQCKHEDITWHFGTIRTIPIHVQS